MKRYFDELRCLFWRQSRVFNKVVAAFVCCDSLVRADGSLLVYSKTAAHGKNTGLGFFLLFACSWWTHTTSPRQSHLLKDIIIYAPKIFSKCELQNANGNVLAKTLHGYTQFEVLCRSPHRWECCRGISKQTTSIFFLTRPEWRKATWPVQLVNTWQFLS